MRTYLRSATALAALVLASAGIAAAQTATQTVTFEVQAINQIDVSGDPGALIINSALAGGAPAPATDATTTYDITSNEANKTITAALDANMPGGLTLTVSLVAPIGATSAGAVLLTTAPVNAVTGINGVAESALGITYVLTASTGAPVTPTDTRVVTLTII